jgi:hypothetical protein
LFGRGGTFDPHVEGRFLPRQPSLTIVRTPIIYRTF